MPLRQSLGEIRAKLVATKRDRTKFLSTHAVDGLLSDLNVVLESSSEEEVASLKDPNSIEHGEFADVCLIFSLALLTVGYTRRPLANYALVVTMIYLFRYLSREPTNTPKELDVLATRLRDIEVLVGMGATNPDFPTNALIDGLLRENIATAEELLSSAQKRISPLSEEDWPIYSQILHIRRDIFAQIVQDPFNPAEVTHTKERLARIEQHVEMEKHSPLVNEQLNTCLSICDDFNDGPYVKPELEPKYKELYSSQKNLEVFLMTHRWTLRETDLYGYMMQILDFVHIIRSQSDYVLSKEGHPPKQYTLAVYLVRKCLAMIYKLLDNAEPVSEALAPIYNQMLTMKRCLVEVHNIGGVSKLRELYPYQMKLNSLDKLRDRDGKFVVEGEIPPGQGVLNALLAECFDELYELEMEVEEQSDNDEEVGYTDDEGDGSDYERLPSISAPPSEMPSDVEES